MTHIRKTEDEDTTPTLSQSFQTVTTLTIPSYELKAPTARHHRRSHTWCIGCKQPPSNRALEMLRRREVPISTDSRAVSPRPALD